MVDMGFSFSAMIRLYEKGSKRKLQDSIMNILDKISSLDSEGNFDQYHESFCEWGIKNIVLAEKFKDIQKIKDSGPASYGQIAKTLDVVLKVVIHYCYWPDQKKSKELKKLLHAAIDNKMMRLLRNHYPDYFHLWPNTVEAVDKEVYKKLQQLVKKFIREKHDDSILPIDFDDIYWNILNRRKEKTTNTFVKRKSHTRGGINKRIEFEWGFDKSTNSVSILNQKGKRHEFKVYEILKVLQQIKIEFGSVYFPLANNVVGLSNGNEVRGLGTIILYLNPGKVRHAQGASYIGPALEELGYFEWNGKNRGIKWRLKDISIDEQGLMDRLSEIFFDG